MAIRFNFNPEAIRIVSDFLQRTEGYQGEDADNFFNAEHANALSAVNEIEVSRHEFETIYELMLDNFIEVNEQPEDPKPPESEPVRNRLLQDLKRLVAKYDGSP